MKQIFLIGDSIRYGVSHPERHEDTGYGVFIKEKLKGKANVLAPNENCRFTHYTLRYLHQWAKETGAGENVDLVCWNNGLWDVLRMYGDEPFTPIDQYGEMLRRIYRRIRVLFPRAKVVFFFSTPVEETLAPKGELVRYDEDVVAYNQKAVEVLSPLGVELLDLYTKAKTLQPTYSRDWMHFTPEGAEQLADFIIDSLGLSELPIEDEETQQVDCNRNSTYEGETI